MSSVLCISFLVIVAVLGGVTSLPEQQLEMEKHSENKDIRSILSGDHLEMRGTTCRKTKCDCRLAGGKCQPKTDICEGDLLTGKQYCSKSKKCGCCVPSQTPIPEEGTITPSILRWNFVGQDFFVSFTERMNWYDARRTCNTYALDLYEPKYVMAVAMYLNATFVDDSWWYYGKYFHIGAQGNGTHMVWLSGEVVGQDMPWRLGSYKSTETTSCLSLTSYPKFINDEGILSADRTSCNHYDRFNYVLCGESPSYQLTWHTVGEDQFATYYHWMTWEDSRAFCKLHGLDLYKPKDFIAVSLYVYNNHNDGVGSNYWIGARGNGWNQVWTSGEVLPSDSPLWWYPNPTHSDGTCTWLYGLSYDFNSGSCIDVWNCASPQGYPMCGPIELTK